MQRTRRLLALVMACMLSLPAGARNAALGIIVHADGGNLGTHPVTEGSSVYAGEELSTVEGGTLQMRSGSVLLQLMSDSSAIVRGDADVETQAFHAELAKGEAVLSVGRGAVGEVCAQAACLRSGGPTPAAMEMKILSPKRLRIHVKRGTAVFKYRGDNANIAEGSTFVVVLDPDDDRTSPRAPSKPPKRFLLIAIAAAMATAIAVPLAMRGHNYESPDKP